VVCDTEILPLAVIEERIRDAAQARIESAHQALAEADARIEGEQATREKWIAEARGGVTDLQQQLQGLAAQRETLEQRAQVFLVADERKEMLAQIHLTFNARQLELEGALDQANCDLDALDADHQAQLLVEALELQLLRGDIETLEQTAPDVADQMRLARDAQANVERAIHLAQEGAVADAEKTLALARAGGADEARITEAERVLADAKRRLATRELIARIQGVLPELPGAVGRLKRLRQEANSAGVLPRVESFLNRALHQARTAASARYREAALHAEHLTGQGLVPCIGDGRMEAWKPAGNKWLLVEVWNLRDNTWVGTKPRVRLIRETLPRRMRKSRWYRGQSAVDSRQSTVVGDA
jgi:hypothetical protein